MILKGDAIFKEKLIWLIFMGVVASLKLLWAPFVNSI